MAYSNNFIVRIRRSNKPNEKPENLEEKEIGINYADKVMHYRPVGSSDIKEYSLASMPPDLMHLLEDGFIVIGRGWK